MKVLYYTNQIRMFEKPSKRLKMEKKTRSTTNVLVDVLVSQ